MTYNVFSGTLNPTHSLPNPSRRAVVDACVGPVRTHRREQGRAAAQLVADRVDGGDQLDGGVLRVGDDRGALEGTAGRGRSADRVATLLRRQRTGVRRSRADLQHRPQSFQTQA